ncbi:hypothetical protein SCLCIDRAFT_1212773 [Scleroderma citrinum Foug A]|uniref:Uncharacterized protein n=1 Tax=Scleroderma citrinum Foug A TaxID=1036808 RepID=A0A0C3E8K1_9AGAM|nr:hypothetical protein SCLCIDRAFT_1212773 [Scleroderma citrinum Foug A]
MGEYKSNLLQTLVHLVMEEVGKIPILHRTARTKQYQFSIDTCLIACGVRCAYLVDAVAPPDPVYTFSALLGSLRYKSALFCDVVLWSDLTHMQTFFVNTKLFDEKVIDSSMNPFFVRLDDDLTEFASPPDEVKEVLLGMRAAMASQGALSFFLPDNLTQVVLVPLAAVLIDYPVAYMPVSPSQTAFLGAEPLDVYEFSCPRKLADTCPRLSHTHLVQRLEDIFTPRLDKIGAGIIVRHHTETLDRVAL